MKQQLLSNLFTLFSQACIGGCTAYEYSSISLIYWHTDLIYIASFISVSDPSADHNVYTLVHIILALNIFSTR